MDYPKLFFAGGELRFLLDAVASRRYALVRWFRPPGRRIRMSPMGSAWLRMHEADYAKHGTDL